METDGAYIPAGTGALDLESIYRAHIASLLKGSVDSRQRIVRNEAFQWFVIAALLFLITGLICVTPFNLGTPVTAPSYRSPASRATQAAVLLCAVSLLFDPQPVAAQPGKLEPRDKSGVSQPAPATGQHQAKPDKSNQPPRTKMAEAQGPGEAEDREEIDDSLAPREVYNRAIDFVRSDPDQAERYLSRARRDAGADGELRFRALYNLGWVEVNRANEKLQDEPQLALQHLQQAAFRFREAVRVRSDSLDARHNLEVVSRRILELTDALHKTDPRDLAARLDALIEQLRTHQAQLQNVVQRAGGEPDQADVETSRQDFRQLGVSQRQIISDVQRFYEDAVKELDALKQKKDEEKSQEEEVRAVQIGTMLAHVERGLQRLNQSRSLTRRLQGNRAFRRWSSGLSDAKRARDQLASPR